MDAASGKPRQEVMMVKRCLLSNVLSGLKSLNLKLFVWCFLRHRVMEEQIPYQVVQ